MVTSKNDCTRWLQLIFSCFVRKNFYYCLVRITLLAGRSAIHQYVIEFFKPSKLFFLIARADETYFYNVLAKLLIFQILNVLVSRSYGRSQYVRRVGTTLSFYPTWNGASSHDDIFRICHNGFLHCCYM